MSVAIIDGTIERADLGRRAKQTQVYKALDIRDKLGTLHSIGRSVAHGEVADQIAVGASGRFYTFKSLDLKGVHGVRKDDGTAAYSHPGAQNVKLFKILIPLLTVLVVGLAILQGGIPVIAAIGLVLSVVGWIVTNNSAVEARAQFDGDGALRAAGRG